MYNDKNGGRAPQGKGAPSPDDFQLNIPDEMFENTVGIDPEQLGMGNTQSFSFSRSSAEEKGDSTQSYYSDAESKKHKKEHKKRDKLKSIKNRRVFRLVWWAMVILVALTLASYLISGSNDLFAVDRPSGKTTIVVPEDVTLDQLTDILVEGGAIKTPDFFKLYCTATTEMKWFKAGTFSNMRTDMDYEGLINYLQAGPEISNEPVQITFQEGLNITEIAALLEENAVCKAEDFLKAANGSDYDKYDMIEKIDNADDKYYKLEGYLFPDTYTFMPGEELTSVIGKMLHNFQNKITSNIMDQIKESDMSLDEVIVMASIIQAEAADNQDMYGVSAVLHNRLERGGERDIYSLDCDSTMYYPYRSKKTAPKDYSSKYDTYEIQTLPAGAISNPGVAAIKAALNPDPEHSDDFYFCHSEDGTPYYAPDAATHDANRAEAGLL